MRGQTRVLKGEQNAGFICPAGSPARQHHGYAPGEVLPQRPRVLGQARPKLLALILEQVCKLGTKIDERRISRFRVIGVDY